MSYHFKNILVLTDNIELASEFIDVCKKLDIPLDLFDFSHSPSTKVFYPSNLPSHKTVSIIDVKDEWQSIRDQYDLVFSVHCKQLFPNELVSAIKCINVHPGLNPYNRGWYPQVFAIINHTPLGATIHEIDAELDHGAIIAQEEVPVYPYDTSYSAYCRVQKAEIRLLENCLLSILKNSYKTKSPIEEGVLHLKKDFDELLRLDLDKKQTIGETIDLLRALSHDEYKNAYFVDVNSQNKIFVKIELYDERSKNNS